MLEKIAKMERPVWKKMGEAKAKAFMKESMDLLKVSNVQDVYILQDFIASVTAGKNEHGR